MYKVIFQSRNQISKKTNSRSSKVLHQVRSPWSKTNDKHFRIQFFKDWTALAFKFLFYRECPKNVKGFSMQTPKQGQII